MEPRPELITREDAHAAGLVRFFTGRPCRRGHVAVRFVSNGACTACLSYKRMPGADAPNMARPPTGYPFPRGVAPTPALISAVHAKVLRLLPSLINEVERDWGMPQMQPGVYQMTEAAKGATRDQMVLAGWTDEQLEAGGYMVKV